MKKIMFMGLLLVFLCLTLTCASAVTSETSSHCEWTGPFQNTEITTIFDTLAINTDCESEDESLPLPVFKLPESLQVIEDEAFEGTAIVSVELPETVESIGSQAFANIPTLQFVKIPETTKVIADNTFDGSCHVAVIASPNSFAGDWARKNGVPFTSIIVMVAGTGSVQLFDSVSTRLTKTDFAAKVETNELEQIYPARPADEIKTEKSDQCIANCVIARAPPVNT